MSVIVTDTYLCYNIESPKGYINYTDHKTYNDQLSFWWPVYGDQDWSWGHDQFGHEVMTGHEAMTSYQKHIIWNISINIQYYDLIFTGS